MGIFRRIWNWLKSLFGGRKNESAELDRYVRQMQEGLRNMKAQTEAIAAAQEKRRREILQCEEEMDKMSRYAQKAVAENRESDARFFLEKKAALAKRRDELTGQRDAAANYTSQAERLCSQAGRQLEEITARKDAVKAKMAAAQLMESMNHLADNRNGSLSAMEENTQAALDRAEAMAELEGRTEDRDLAELMSRYDEEDAGQPAGGRA